MYQLHGTITSPHMALSSLTTTSLLPQYLLAFSDCALFYREISLEFQGSLHVALPICKTKKNACYVEPCKTHSWVLRLRARRKCCSIPKPWGEELGLAGSFPSSFLKIFWPHHTAHGLLVARPGIEPMPPAVAAWSLIHWTTSKVQQDAFLFLLQP